MRKVLLAAFLICPAIAGAQNAGVPPPSPPSATRTIPAPAQPAAAVKGAEKGVQSEQKTLDKSAQEKSQKANDALVERHNAAARRAIGNICAGCGSSRRRVRTASAPRSRTPRHERPAPDDELSFSDAERQFEERQAAGSARPSGAARERWWNGR